MTKKCRLYAACKVFLIYSTVKLPAIDIVKSGTRREDLLLSEDEQEAVNNMRRALNGMKSEEAAENILNMFARTRTNGELVHMLRKQKII